MKQLRLVPGAVVLALAATAPGLASAAAIHDAGLFTNILPANDDGSTSAVNLGFTADINGTSYAQTYVNNNGNLTFSQSLSQYTPSAIVSNPFPIIAAYWADVDTRGAGSGLTTYGAATLAGRNVFGVDWINVGYYANGVDKLNSFQLILTDRSDVGTGDFDIQFNYDKVLWETGGASGGSDGLGGTSAAVGYVVGTGNSLQLPGSFVNGALLDGGSNSLVANELNSTVAGQYNFQVRGGQVVPVVPSVPEPETYLLMACGLGALALGSRKRQHTA